MRSFSEFLRFAWSLRPSGYYHLLKKYTLLTPRVEQRNKAQGGARPVSGRLNFRNFRVSRLGVIVEKTCFAIAYKNNLRLRNS